MGIAAGRLRERVTFRRMQDVATGRGGYDRAWQPLPGMTNVPAEVLSQGGREAVIANTLQGNATYRITIRFVAGIQAADQVLWEGLELNILAPPAIITDRGRRIGLQILADTSAPQNAK